MSEHRWAPVVAVAVVVVAGSLVPLAGGHAGGGTTGPGPPGVDKLLHAAGYAAVAYLLARALGARGTGSDARVPAAALAAAVGGAALGGGVELLQALVPGRTPSLADAAANLGGAAVGGAARLLRPGQSIRANDRQ